MLKSCKVSNDFKFGRTSYAGFTFFSRRLGRIRELRDGQLVTMVAMIFKTSHLFSLIHLGNAIKYVGDS